MPVGDDITVRVLKYDGAEYRRWDATVTKEDGSLLVLDAEFDIDVTHDLLGEIRRGTRTVEYFWLDRWYNVFRFLTAEGLTYLWYCNINVPPRFEYGLLTYIDLDVDILVQPTFSHQVLDLDEFEINARRYGYSEEEKERAQAAVDELISMIANRQFPFQF